MRAGDRSLGRGPGLGQVLGDQGGGQRSVLRESGHRHPQPAAFRRAPVEDAGRSQGGQEIEAGRAQGAQQRVVIGAAGAGGKRDLRPGNQVIEGHKRKYFCGGPAPQEARRRRAA